MKVIRHQCEHNGDEFYAFVKRNLPPSLEWKTESQGYAYILVLVPAAASAEEGWVRRFRRRMCKIGRVYTDGIELYRPEFFSDISDLLAKWEAGGGSKTMKLEYWES